MSNKAMIAYMKTLVRAYKAAMEIEYTEDAQRIKEMWNEAMYAYTATCGSVDAHEAMRPLAKEIGSDFFDA